MQLYMTRHGCVQPIRPGDVEPDDIPVTVIPTADWLRLVATWERVCSNLPTDDIDSDIIDRIIASVNGGE